MTDLELLAELIDDLYRDLRPEIETLTEAEFHLYPAPQRNSIAVTVWHMARGLDFLGRRILQGKAAEEELWHTAGWKDRTGYDPRGKGYGGWGVLTGYSWEDVLDIPDLSIKDSLEYLEQTSRLVSGLVRGLDSEQAQAPVQEFFGGKLTTYRWVKDFYKGFQAHIGEILAIKAQLVKNRGLNG